jgi:hypothetical protein
MRRTRFWNSAALTGMMALAALVVPVRAQDPDDLKRGVARISLINGDVSVRRGDTSDWVAGVVNAPLLTDDRIATGPASRTEVQFDASNTLRLGANAELHLAQLEYGRYQLELSRGLATFRILHQTDVNVEIDTPSVSVRPSRQGSVRIAVNDAGETEVTSRSGDVEVFTPRGSQWVRPGQTLMARGSAADPEFQIVAAAPIDDWDRWCESRDRLLLQSQSQRYVGPGVYGAEDLDNYGTWETVPEYGPVWHPTVAADWAPYSYGRWAWVDWYGWTWVSSDPWGWAPYHYGRWFHNDRFGWCWYPGVITARHYWSPALVGFIGFGGGGGFGFGFGNVGWVPLAPYEVYHPWWGRAWYRSGGYYNRQVNIVNVNVTNTYRNARYNGISSVSHTDFLAGRFNSVTRFNGTQIHDAGAIRGATPFSPAAQHLRFSDRNVANVPRVNESARFFRSQTPSPVQRVPLQQQVGRTGPGGGSDSPSRWSRFGQTGGNPRSQVAPGGSERGGFGSSPQQRSQMPQQQFTPRTEQVAPRQENRGGWQRFGSPTNGGGAPQQQPQRQAAPRDQYMQQYRQSPSEGRTFGNPRGQSQPQQQHQPPQRQEYNGPSRGYDRGGQSLRVAPPVVRERPSYSPPSYSAPRQSSPGNSAPRQSAPSYGGPRQSGGGGSSAPRGNSGGGHQSNGGGGNRHGR